MEVAYIIIAVLILALPVLLTRLLSGGRKETEKVIGVEPPRPVADPRLHGLHEEVVKLLDRRRKMEAIRLTQQRTGLAPGAAREAVESIAKEKATASLRAPGLIATIKQAQEMSEEVQRLVAKGQKIEAVKLLRERSALGLKEAKELVDRLG